MTFRDRLTTGSRFVLLLVALWVVPSPASATWSVIAMDTASGRLVVSSATCVAQERFATFPAQGLMDIQAVVVPGIGVAVAQAGVDRTRENQRLIFRELQRGTPPEEIVGMLSVDPDFERRQFAILDREGRGAGHSGARNRSVSTHMVDRVPGTDIVFSVQGNILAGYDVVHAAARSFREGDGDIVERTMRAMEVADAHGGDRGCTCASEPFPNTIRSCTLKTSHVAYLVVAEPGDPLGESFNDGDYSLFIDVHDQNIRPEEDQNPVTTLRMRLDAVRESEGLYFR